MVHDGEKVVAELSSKHQTYDEQVENGTFIANAPADLAWLLDQLEAAQARAAAAEARLERAKSFCSRSGAGCVGPDDIALVQKLTGASLEACAVSERSVTRSPKSTVWSVSHGSVRHRLATSLPGSRRLTSTAASTTKPPPDYSTEDGEASSSATPAATSSTCPAMACGARGPTSDPGSAGRAHPAGRDPPVRQPPAPQPARCRDTSHAPGHGHRGAREATSRRGRADAAGARPRRLNYQDASPRHLSGCRGLSRGLRRRESLHQEPARASGRPSPSR